MRLLEILGVKKKSVDPTKALLARDTSDHPSPINLAERAEDIDSPIEEAGPGFWDGAALLHVYRKQRGYAAPHRHPMSLISFGPTKAGKSSTCSTRTAFSKMSSTRRRVQGLGFQLHHDLRLMQRPVKPNARRSGWPERKIAVTKKGLSYV